MEAPESVVLGLKGIRETFELRWNPTAVLAKGGSFDGSGRVIQPEYDPRWELWDKPDGYPEYLLLTLQNPDGGFRAPGQWIVELFRLFNPERYGGDVTKMLEELIDKPQQLREDIADKDADDLFEQVAKWWDYARKVKVTTLTAIS